MDWKVDDIPLFVATVNHRGVSAAAAQLGIPKSSVSRAISRLEDALGVRLLERNSRNIRITSEGEVFYRRCQSIMDEVAQTNAEMSGLIATPGGRLVVAMPMAFSREVFARYVSRFIERYPAVELEVIITSHDVDIIRDHIDLAVVLGPLEDSELVAKPLVANHLVWVASPQYARENRIREKVSDILRHVKVCETRYAKSRQAFLIKDKKEQLDLRHAMQVNDPLVVKEAVSQGAGISLLPLLYCRDELRDGTLVEVLPSVRMEDTGNMAVVYPGRRHISNKVRAFIAFLEEALEEIVKKD